MPPNYLMGNLPTNRDKKSRPFENSGIDYCGPFLIKEKQFRNRDKTKVYIVVFICCATKAVRMELASDLTTETYLAAINRFHDRRGISRNLYTDNETNFFGLKNEIFSIQARAEILVRRRSGPDREKCGPGRVICLAPDQ